MAMHRPMDFLNRHLTINVKVMAQDLVVIVEAADLAVGILYITSYRTSRKSQKVNHQVNHIRPTSPALVAAVRAAAAAAAAAAVAAVK